MYQSTSERIGYRICSMHIMDIKTYRSMYKSYMYNGVRHFLIIPLKEDVMICMYVPFSVSRLVMEQKLLPILPCYASGTTTYNRGSPMEPRSFSI